MRLSRYRYRTPALVGPWRKSPERAIKDAVKAGQAMPDDTSGRGWRWTAPGVIEEEPSPARE